MVGIEFDCASNFRQGALPLAHSLQGVPEIIMCLGHQRILGNRLSENDRCLGVALLVEADFTK